LKFCQRTLKGGPEDAVDTSGIKAQLGEVHLEIGDVVAAHIGLR
jgi:hypothetical protein